MKIYAFLPILAVSTLLLSACSFSSGIRTDNDKTVLPETDENKIKVFSGSEIPHQHLIGEVFAYQDLCECPEKVISLLKEEAAAMGANAIMGLELQYLLVATHQYQDINLNQKKPKKKRQKT